MNKIKTLIGGATIAATLGIGLAGPAHADYLTVDHGGEDSLAVGGISGGKLEVFVQEGAYVEVTIAIVTEDSTIDSGFNKNESCNIHGDEWQLRVGATSSVPGTATVPSAPMTFNLCDDTQTLRITGVQAGESTVTLAQTVWQYDKDTEVWGQADLDKKGDWRTAPTIDVTVTAATPPVPRGYWKHATAVANQVKQDCNPLWATNQTKKSPAGTNGHGMLTSYLSAEFAAWHGVASDDPQYIDKVQDELDAAFASESEWTTAMAAYAEALCASKDAESVFF